MNTQVSTLLERSKELKKPLIFEKEQEFNAIADKIMNIVGYERYCEHESLCNEYTQLAEERAYTEGFKDAFKLFMELHG